MPRALTALEILPLLPSFLLHAPEGYLHRELASPLGLDKNQISPAKAGKKKKEKKKSRAVQLRLCAKGFTSRMCANMFLSYKPFFIQGSQRPYKGCRVSAREGSTASIPAV